MTANRLDECIWPPLASPYAEALRHAVSFVLDEVDPIGIIATGTIVRGQPHASSDLDLFVIHAAPYRRRIQRFFREVPTEIFINPASAVRRYFADEHRDARPITAHMIATGAVVLQSDPVIAEIRREAAEWLARPPRSGDEQNVRDRYAAATRFEDATDVGETDTDTATMLMTLAVTAMLEHDCRVKDGRVPRAKELLGVIARRDAELGRLAREFFAATSYGQRHTVGEAIADRTIGARGFFEWDSGAEPVRPTNDSDDRAAIDAVRDAWMAVVASGDARGLADFVTPDYEVWAHGAPVMGGPQTVVALMGAALAKYSVKLSYDALETVIAGVWAFQRGVERIRAVPHDGGPAQEQAQRALLILRRCDDGRWRYARGMTNGLPPGA
jgi:ketosteroid isomerase-like protein/predicted nucleotidyltransferase